MLTYLIREQILKSQAQAHIIVLKNELRKQADEKVYNTEITYLCMELKITLGLCES